MLLFAGFGLV